MTVDGTDYRKVDGAYAHLGWQSFNKGPGGSGWTSLSQYLWPFLDALAAAYERIEGLQNQYAQLQESEGKLLQQNAKLIECVNEIREVLENAEGVHEDIDMKRMSEALKEIYQEKNNL